MTCKWKVFCKQGDTCVAHNGYDILKCTAFKDKGVPMTNEEWFCQLPTEEKAKVISKLDCLHGNVYEIEEWLKQPHTRSDKNAE